MVEIFYTNNLNQVDSFQLPNYVNQMIPIFLISLIAEIFISYRRFCKNERVYHDFNDVICSLVLGSVQELFHFIIKPLFFIPYLYVWSNFRIVTFSTDSYISFIIALLGIDLAVYSFHRVGHEINFFWAIHIPHHSSEHYNLSTATRQGIFQYISAWLHYLPLALIVNPVHYSFHHHWNRIFQFYLHTETFKGKGFLDKIFVTPSHHQVHHASNPEYIDKNYGGILIIWDKLFGTFVEEKEHVEIKYGVIDNIDDHSPAILNCQHFIYMYKLSKQLKGISKLKVLWKSPNWLPEHDDPSLSKSTNGQKEEQSLEIEQESKSKRSMNDIASKWICLYSIMEIIGISSFLSILETHSKLLELEDMLYISTILIVQFIYVGMVLNRNHSHQFYQCNNIYSNNNMKNNGKEQQPIYNSNFGKYYNLLSTTQSFRLVITSMLLYQMSNWHSTIESEPLNMVYYNLSVYTVLQLIIWIISINLTELKVVQPSPIHYQQQTPKSTEECKILHFKLLKQILNI
ncbi:hypothetical protein DLAC_09264 [Tieghemostelium lacteum]|uniref:Fatty acid hydroxylase domain-containing protein n=1 Tax=Tieghemostelium lacteum TaxID=361077 RepID=A0A151Z9U1_TIELA|nr:hypothetical protein DLAC_09264 [Tieghemostelium lacteum]|eukprot:KYQ90634.1 hypothetical protein DLAC_09264 [Tieghemostelium lacteum]